ncbi:MAG: NAD-binding protein [Salinimicrobium sediminis]|nr:NAD-binding protein [Salinimicrobium sediminis]
MKILIIGFGHLGKCLSAKFLEKGWGVIVLDIKPLKKSLRSVPSGMTLIQGDATKKNVLAKIDWKDISEVYICIRKDEAANLLASLVLKDIGVPNVTSAYISDLQAQALSYKEVRILDTAAETANVIAH